MKSSSLLFVIIVILTFPIWMGVAGGLIGLVFGIIGGAIGLVFGILGSIIGLFGSIIGAFFGWDNHWGDMHWHHFNPNPSHAFWVVIFVVALGLALRSRSRRGS